MEADQQLLALSAAELQRRIRDARDAILSRRLLQPHVAIILGSGLGDLAERVEHPTAIDYADIPSFPCTHAVGHAGRLILGYLSGVPVVLMQGRSHRYEGFANQHVRFPVYCMQALGAETLITTNAAGGLNPRFQQGELMVIDGHIDWLWSRGLWPESNRGLSPPFRRNSPYDYDLMHLAKSVARRQDIILQQGTYLGTLGPTYETRSEYRLFRRMGADAVGMSTIPEVQTAWELSMAVLAFSVITNVASTDVPQSTTHDEVVDSGNQAGPQLMQVIEQVLERLAGHPD